jgi:predicted amidophosphoribosyltransferase
MRRPAPVPTPVGLDRCHALLAYAGAGRELVARLKYRNARASVRWLGAAMADLVDEPPALVTWVPTTPERHRARGFDQAELLARAVARVLGVPCRCVIRRHAGSPQTGAPAATRRAARPQMSARRRCAGTVLLVDDVTTTGTTLSCAAAVLRDAGASRIIGLLAARTPAPGDLH